MRFRWGLSAMGGPLLFHVNGGMAGLDFRLGAQLSREWGLYAQPIAFLGAGVSVGGAGGGATSAAAIALAGTGVLVDFTLEDLFFVALGPEVLFGGFGTARVDPGTGTSVGTETGPFFSAASRVGFALGSSGVGGRNALTIGFDMHLVFASEPIFAPMFALGFDSF